LIYHGARRPPFPPSYVLGREGAPLFLLAGLEQSARVPTSLFFFLEAGSRSPCPIVSLRGAMRSGSPLLASRGRARLGRHRASSQRTEAGRFFFFFYLRKPAGRLWPFLPPLFPPSGAKRRGTMERRPIFLPFVGRKGSIGRGVFFLSLGGQVLGKNWEPLVVSPRRDFAFSFFPSLREA